MNRRLMILLWVALASLPARGRAIDACSECVLGIWDDAAMTRNYGEIVAGQPKDIYVGIKFAEGFDELQGISLSIQGLRSFLVAGMEVIGAVVVICDVLGSPADTSHVGGCDFPWPTCLTGNRILLRITILTFDEVNNGLLRVDRRYPPHPLDATGPTFFRCNQPSYTPVQVRGGAYILNWDGDPSVLVAGTTWSTVKQQYQ